MVFFIPLHKSVKAVDPCQTGYCDTRSSLAVPVCALCDCLPLLKTALIGDCFKILTVIEAVFSDSSDGVRNCKTVQSCTASEHISADHRAFITNGSQSRTISESIVADSCNIWRNRNGCECRAPKTSAADACHCLRDDDVCQLSGSADHFIRRHKCSTAD